MFIHFSSQSIQDTGERILDYYKKYRHGSVFVAPGTDAEGIEKANKLGAKAKGRRDTEGLYDELFEGYDGKKELLFFVVPF